MSFDARAQALLSAFSRFSGTLGARSDYVQGGGGNTSVKLDDTLMAIKASGFLLSDIRPDHAYAVLDYAALRKWYRGTDPAGLADVEKEGSSQAKALTKHYDFLKPLRPSVEAGFHALLSRFVGHTHSVWANLAACAKDGERWFKEALDGADYDFAVVPYVDPGARLTFSIRDILSKAKADRGKEPEVLLMLNHGLVAHHDDEDRCLAIHEDVNKRVSVRFGLSMDDFPKAGLEKLGADHYRSATPWLKERLKGDKYSDQLLLDAPLYPDQMVFFKGTLGQTMVIDRATGDVDYRMAEQTAKTMEDTLLAVLFILETLEKRGLHPVSMGSAAQAFISGWESEKYRKGLAEGKA